MEFKDYYAVLGVSPDADDKTIKTAYRKLARQYHPDVSSHENAEEKFKEVAEAYEVLHNKDKRAEYDEIRMARSQRQRYQQQGGGGFSASDQSNADFADFFSSIFGAGARGGYSQREQAFSRKGGDIEIELPIFLEETLTEFTKPVQFTMQYEQQGRLQEQTKSLNVKIPAGVTEGERIRLKGQGTPGTGGATNGDLYLHIRLVPHPLFDVEGHNLIISVPLAPWEAALGKKVRVPTLSGHIELTIPPNSQSGQRLRIKGKGLVGKHGQGDLYAILKVVMPPKSDASVNALWTQLAQQADFDPRTEWSK
jgi:curved DNA-binding protein